MTDDQKQELKSKLKAILAENMQFSHPPETKGDFAAVKSWWDGQMAIMLNTIVSNLKTCEETKGEIYYSNVLESVKDELRRARFHHCNPFTIWKSIYKKASRKADQDLKRMGIPLPDAAEQALFQAKLKAASRRALERRAS